MLIVYKFKRELPVGLVILLLLERLEQVSDAVCGECRFAKDTHDLKYGPAYLELMFDVCNEAVCDDVNLSMDSDARLCTSELGPSEYCHAEVNGRRIDCVEPAVQLKLFRDAFALSNRHHVEGKLLKDTMVSESIRPGQYLPVDGLTAKAEVFGFSTMSNREICKFPEASTAHQLAKHQIQHMIPMRHRPVCGSVVVPGNDTSELPLRKELYYLCKNELSNMHIYSGLKSYAKIRISKPGQGIGELKRCA